MMQCDNLFFAGRLLRYIVQQRVFTSDSTDTD